MDPQFRARFNAAFTPQRYARYAADLELRAGCAIGFRLAETPFFLGPEFRRDCERAADEVIAQLAEPERLARMRAAVPARWDVPNAPALPNVAVIDFAVALGKDGAFVPRLVELQGFPSLLAFEVLQLDAWSDALAEIPGCEGGWSSFFGGRGRAAFLELARRTIVGDCDPAEVALVDLAPEQQKTYVDFAATEQLFGVEPVCVTALRKRGRRLFRRDAAGRERPIARVYWRLVIDEIERRNVSLPFDLRDELDVVWVPHPNWFWTWSKYSLPFLDHPSVPRTRLLSELDALPDELEERFVLKPLFSFAGGGVNVAPTAGDVAAIAGEDRALWCLQEKIDYGGAIVAADDGGHVKAEIRVMFLRPDGGAALEAATNLCRLSRGAMHGVDYNKNRTWVGSTIGIWRGAKTPADFQ